VYFSQVLFAVRTHRREVFPFNKFQWLLVHVGPPSGACPAIFVGTRLYFTLTGIVSTLLFRMGLPCRARLPLSAIVAAEPRRRPFGRVGEAGCRFDGTTGDYRASMS
jgi:hypothetical protein